MIRGLGMPVTSRSRPRPAARIFGRKAPKYSNLRMIYARLARRTAAMAERVYPVLLVFTIFATVLIATIALRLIIWLPMYRH